MGDATTGGSAAERLRQQALFPVAYMFVATFLLASVLVGVARFTAERVQANSRVLFERAVLESIGIEPDGGTPLELHRVFEQRISPPSEAAGGAHVVHEGERVFAYVLPVEGQGFWDVIRGVVGIAPDGRSLLGIAFYEQHETPGLGAEIVRKDFRRQFESLLLGSDEEAPVMLRPPGAQLGTGDVHAITGATQTCTRLEGMLQRALSAWRRKMGFSS